MKLARDHGETLREMVADLNALVGFYSHRAEWCEGIDPNRAITMAASAGSALSAAAELSARLTALEFNQAAELGGKLCPGTSARKAAPPTPKIPPAGEGHVPARRKTAPAFDLPEIFVTADGNNGPTSARIDLVYVARKSELPPHRCESIDWRPIADVPTLLDLWRLYGSGTYQLIGRNADNRSQNIRVVYQTVAGALAVRNAREGGQTVAGTLYGDEH